MKLRFERSAPRARRLAVAVAVAALVGCSPPDVGPELERSSPSGLEPAGTELEARLLMVDGAFEPQELTVAAGTLIILENRDGADHTVTHGENGEPAADALFDIVVDGGGRQELTISEPGEYSVTCRFHPEMSMTITVVE